MDIEDEMKRCKDKLQNIKGDILNRRATIKSQKKTLLSIESELNVLGSPESDQRNVKNEAIKVEGDGQVEYKKNLQEVTEDLFKPLTQKLKNSYRKVEVVFNGKPIGFQVHARDTFMDLSIKVASYIGLKAEETFFCDSPSVNSAIYQNKENIFYELFCWKSMSIRFVRPRIYLIEAKNGDADHYPRIFQQEIYLESETKFVEPEDITVDIIRENTMQVKKRVKRNFTMNLLQSLLMLGFWIMWMLTLISEQKFNESSWMNDTIFEGSLRESLNDITNSIYNDKPNNHFLKIHSEERFWSYLSDENFRISRAEQSQEQLMYNYEALELRQVRSDMKLCEVEDYGTAPCLKKYSLSPNEDDYSSQGQGFIYDDEGKSANIFGGIDHYHADGFKIEFSYSDLASWNEQMLLLISDKWIDPQTRAIFMTNNIVNPSIGIMTTSVQIIEIGPHGSYTPFIKLYSFNYSVDYLEFGFHHGIIIIWLIVLLMLELRSNLISYEEVVFTEKRELNYLKESLSPELLEREMKKILEIWKLNDKKRLMSRFRKPRAIELIRIGCLLSALMISLFGDVWFLSIMSTFEMNEDEYTNFLTISQAISWIRDFKLIIGIVLSSLLCKALGRFLVFLEEFVYMLQDVLSKFLPLILCLYSLLVLFSGVFYFIFGPYSYFAWSYQLALTQCIWIMFGNLDLDTYFYMFGLHGEIFTVLILIRVFSFVVLLYFVANLYMELLDVRTLHLARIRKENKAKNRHIKI